MLRAIVAIIFVGLAVALDALTAAYLPSGYTSGLAVLVPLTGFAAIAWAFVPNRNRGRTIRSLPRRIDDVDQARPHIGDGQR